VSSLEALLKSVNDFKFKVISEDIDDSNALIFVSREVWFEVMSEGASGYYVPYKEVDKPREFMGYKVFICSDLDDSGFSHFIGLGVKS